jgi:hypothetical protein
MLRAQTPGTDKKKEPLGAVRSALWKNKENKENNNP